MAFISLHVSSVRHSIAALLAVCIASLCGCATTSPHYNNQRAFGSPEDAVKSLQSAVRAGDNDQLHVIFGPDGHEILASGDPVADRMNREVFLVAFDQRWTLERLDRNTRELVIGHEEWPFPIPLVQDRHGWWFDTLAGKDEVLARRIGRNELAAIGVLQTYVVAQWEYASESRDGKPTGIYAQKIRSDPGVHNGLYWPADSASEPLSPLGEFAAAADAAGYGTQRPEGAAPYQGYFFRILTRQGPAAPGGEQDYIVNGEMTRGFAMIAFPAEYGNSGIMTFIVGPEGLVYEADLGERTSYITRSIQSYNPDARWLLVD